MIHLIIVEDERIIRNGIENHVPWEELGVGEVRTAENAKEAFSICEDCKPDIIISDIRMPGMNGIELCRKFREQLPESQIIFISGFSDKEYLMAGISLGAISYVEKPIDIVELSEAVKKAVASVHRLHRQNTNVLHSLLRPCDLEEDSAIRGLHLFEQGKILEHDKVFCISVLESREEVNNVLDFNRKCQDMLHTLIGGKDIHFIADSMGNNMVVILLSSGIVEQTKNMEFKSLVSETLLSVRGENEAWFLGVGEDVSALNMLSQSYQSALEALKSLSYKGWNTYAFYSEDEIEYQGTLSENKRNQFHKTLLNKKEKEALSMLSEICKMLLDNHAVLNFHVRNIYFTLDNIITQVDKVLHLNGLEQGEVVNAKFLDQAKTIDEMQEYVCKHVKEVLEETEEEQKNNFLIKHVMEYMNENFHSKELSIQVLADVVYLTPTYLSGLFKKKTGMTIGQYLTNIRIKKAEEILKNPQLKLYQVAEMVGYEDANYFSKIFKKKTGMLPSEYREIK
ncbi:MAG: response regulator [Velocimicrobium sp.]